MNLPEEIAQFEYSLLLAIKRVESLATTQCLVLDIAEENSALKSLETHVESIALFRKAMAYKLRILRYKLKSSEARRAKLLLEKYFR